LDVFDAFGTTEEEVLEESSVNSVVEEVDDVDVAGAVDEVAGATAVGGGATPVLGGAVGAGATLVAAQRTWPMITSPTAVGPSRNS